MLTPVLPESTTFLATMRAKLFAGYLAAAESFALMATMLSELPFFLAKVPA